VTAAEVRPRLAYLALGGTIASVGRHGEGAVVSLSGSEILGSLPGIAAVAHVDVRSFRQLPGAELTMADLLALAEEIRRLFRAGVDGVVVTQGTDTLEETAFVLDLLIEEDAPVVLTGAMRNPSVPGADGAANLLAAIQVAAAGTTRGQGAVVVFNDEIHAARLVRKRHTSSTATFGSPSAGALGYVTEGKVELLLRTPGRLILRLPDAPDPARVALITIGFDDDGALLQGIETDFDGVVVAGYGGGHVPSRIVPLLDHLNQRIPVILASRTFFGPMLTRTYGFPGSEMDLLSRGLISSAAVDPIHARILLRLLLMAHASRSTIAQSFQQVLTVRDKQVVDPTCDDAR
jgi:L-asparaginase